MEFRKAPNKILSKAKDKTEQVIKNRHVQEANPLRAETRNAWGISDKVLTLLGAVFIYVLVISLTQGAGFFKGLILAYGAGGFCLGIALLWKGLLARAVRATPWMVYVLIGLVIFWFWINGTHHLMIFIVAFILGSMAAGFAARIFVPSVEGKEQENWVNVTVNRFFLVLGLATWLAASGLIALFAADPCEHGNLSRSITKEEWNGLSVGLALSGGGYRAALMHAGVLKYLNEKKVPITHISTVSGGSIIGAFYAVGGKPEDFKAAVKDNRLNILRDIWSPSNLLRLWTPLKLPFSEVRLFPWYSYGRVDIQARALDRVLLNGKTLKELRGNGQPRLQICTTDLIRGNAVGIAQDGVFFQRIERFAGDKEGQVYFKNVLGQEPLARIVAASGAFPVALDPVSVSFPNEGPERLPAPDGRAVGSEVPGENYRDTNTLELLLGDGGLVDNLGVKLLLGRQKKAKDWRINILLVSDGGKSLEHEKNVSGFMDQLSRAADIVYEGSGWRPPSQNSDVIPCNDGSESVCRASKLGNLPIVFLRPAELNQEIEEVKIFNQTGTLNARIKSREADALFRLGEMIAKIKWQQIEGCLNCLAQRAKEH